MKKNNSNDPALKQDSHTVKSAAQNSETVPYKNGRAPSSTPKTGLSCMKLRMSIAKQ